ncbi:MAG: outer membrane beta-barrel domain-containing protein [Deltaproteobacteria bacterium]|nr:outer membrane beta-barrel domain-containing protein [Deltaproteobacteria bacterium]
MKSIATIASLLLVLFAAPRVRAEDEEAVEEEETQAKAPSAAVEPKTLAERIPSVTARVFAKRGRMELTPAVGLSANDPFFRHILLSGRAAYHVAEWLWVEAGGDFYGSMQTAVPVVGAGAVAKVGYNRPVYDVDLAVGFAPLYGKLSLMAEKVIHFDTYVTVGAGAVGPAEGSMSLAGSAAVGQRYFVSEWLALRLEVRDLAFMMARAPSVSTDQKLQNVLSFSLGLSFFVPSTFEHEKL